MNSLPKAVIAKLEEYKVMIEIKHAISKEEANLVLDLYENTRTKDEEIYSTKIIQNKDLLERNVMSILSKPLLINTSKGFKILSWLNYFEYLDKGVVSYALENELTKHFEALRDSYNRAECKTLLTMKTGYSKRLYLLIREFLSIGEVVFDVESLCVLLDVPKSFSSSYSNMKRKVFLIAERDINAFSDIQVELFEQKEGKKVKRVGFKIKRTRSRKNILLTSMKLLVEYSNKKAERGYDSS